MNRAAQSKKVALALTWDGARWPVRALPQQARGFLAAEGHARPSRREMAALLAGEVIREMRICWVPRLKGGDEVMADPFQTLGGKRLSFRAGQIRRFGDILGVIYRR
jgi:hypothetical protein